MRNPYSYEDLRHLGLDPGKIFVLGMNLLGRFPQLQVTCCDHEDVRQLLRNEGILQDEVTEVSDGRLFIYFSARKAAVRFIDKLNKYLKHKD